MLTAHTTGKYILSYSRIPEPPPPPSPGFPIPPAPPMPMPPAPLMVAQNGPEQPLPPPPLTPEPIPAFPAVLDPATDIDKLLILFCSYPLITLQIYSLNRSKEDEV